MDPVTVIGLVASLVTLADLATKSVKASLKIIKSIDSIPEDILRLVEQVVFFDNLLHVVKQRGLHNLDPDLTSLWVEASACMKADILAFSKTVSHLAGCLDRPTISKLWLRTSLRLVLSKEKVKALKESFKTHIVILSFIETQFTR